MSAAAPAEAATRDGRADDRSPPRAKDGQKGAAGKRGTRGGTSPGEEAAKPRRAVRGKPPPKARARAKAGGRAPQAKAAAAKRRPSGDRAVTLSLSVALLACVALVFVTLRDSRLACGLAGSIHAVATLVCPPAP